MKIDKHLKFPVAFQLQLVPNEFSLHSPVLVPFLVLVLKEMPVQVLALKVRIVITNNDTVWVDHGNHPNFVMISQFVTQQLFRKEFVDQSVDGVAAIGLTWVLPSYQRNDGLVCLISPVSDLQNRHVDSPHRQAHRPKLHEIKSYTLYYTNPKTTYASHQPVA